MCSRMEATLRLIHSLSNPQWSLVGQYFTLELDICTELTLLSEDERLDLHRHVPARNVHLTVEGFILQQDCELNSQGLWTTRETRWSSTRLHSGIGKVFCCYLHYLVVGQGGLQVKINSQNISEMYENFFFRFILLFSSTADHCNQLCVSNGSCSSLQWSPDTWSSSGVSWSSN